MLRYMLFKSCNDKGGNGNSSAQIINLFQEECFFFKSTSNALDYQNANNLSFPSCIKEAFQGSSITPFIKWEESISRIISEAKHRIGGHVALNPIMTNLCLCKNEDILSTTEVFLVTEEDCGKFISVFNSNWMFLTPDLQIEKPFLAECEVPAYIHKHKGSEDDDEEYRESDILGCYIPQCKVIFLWIDRIHKASNNINTNLLFQKVLLHELIHALLDWNLRDENLNVFGIADPEKIEETITNTLMLKVYFDSCKTSFDEVLKFVKTQSLPYASAAKMFECFQSTNGWGSFVNILSNYLENKVSGNNQIPNQVHYFSVEGDELPEGCNLENWVNGIYYHSLGCFTSASYIPPVDIITNDFFHDDIVFENNCPFFIINNEEAFVKRVSIYRGRLSTGEIILKLFFTFSNKSQDAVYVATYDAIKNQFNFPDNSQNTFSFTSYRSSEVFGAFLLSYPYNHTASLDKYIPDL